MSRQELRRFYYSCDGTVDGESCPASMIIDAIDGNVADQRMKNIRWHSTGELFISWYCHRHLKVVTP